MASDGSQVLRGYGYHHGVRDNAFYVPRLLVERWADSGPIAGYRSCFGAAGSADPEDVEVIGTEPGRTPC